MPTTFGVRAWKVNVPSPPGGTLSSTSPVVRIELIHPGAFRAVPRPGGSVPNRTGNEPFLVQVMLPVFLARIVIVNVVLRGIFQFPVLGENHTGCQAKVLPCKYSVRPGSLNHAWPSATRFRRS